MSLGASAYKVGGAGQCSSVRRRYPWQPCKRLPPGTITLNNSVEYLLTNTYLALTSKGREGGMRKTKAQIGMQAASYCKELQARNRVYKSLGAPAKGIGPPPV